MYGWLNVGSLVLGLIAWILPVVNLRRYKKHDCRNWAVLSITSLSACAISVCFQLFYNSHLVTIQDWAALADTTDHAASISAILVIVTIILNVISLLVCRDRTAKKMSNSSL